MSQPQSSTAEGGVDGAGPARSRPHRHDPGQLFESEIENQDFLAASATRAVLLAPALDQPLVWPAGAAPPDALIAAARLAERSGEPVTADTESAESTIAVPLRAAKRVVGAAAFSLRLDGHDVRDAMRVVHASTDRLARALDAGRAPTPPVTGDAQVLLEGMRGDGALPDRLRALADALAGAFRCQRVAIARVGRRGRVALAAVSGEKRYGARTPLANRVRHDLARALAAVADARAHGRRAVTLSGEQPGALLLLAPGARSTVAGLVFERPEGAGFDAEERERLEMLAPIIGTVLELAFRAERDPVSRCAYGLRRLAGTRRSRSLLVAAVVLAGVVLAFAPGPYRIKASASVEGETQRALVAPMETYIEAVHAVAGDEVSAGSPLIEFAADDLRLEQIKWASERARATSARRDAAARQERARLRVLDAEIAHANAELELVQAQLARLVLKAPIDGVIISGDLSQRLGAPVRRGEVLFEIVPRGAYRLALHVDEHDINDVREGMTGTLKLNAFPGERLRFDIERVTPVADVTAAGNHFLAYARINASGVPLRPGMAGISRIDAGERARIASWTRALRQWLTLQWWRWFG